MVPVQTRQAILIPSCARWSLCALVSAGISACSIPKHHALKDLGDFDASGCAVLKVGGYAWPEKYSGGLLNKARRVTFFKPGQPQDPRPSSISLPQGTRIHVEDIKTWWDFENGDRLFITGTLALEGKEQPFAFEEYSATEDLARELLSPCHPSNGVLFGPVDG